MYQNRATLMGFLGKDAEVRTTQNTQARYTVLSLVPSVAGATANRASA